VCRPVCLAALSGSAVRLRSRAVAVLALAAAGVAAPVQALDLGFEAYTSIIATDNAGANNSPDEEDGLIGTGVVGIYGEQRSRVARAAFSGEIDGRRRFDDDDQRDIDTVTRFLGAAEFQLTPQVFTWYVGDILGGVRVDNALQPISDNVGTVQRRNVFVTGPSAEFELDRDTTLSSRLLYINQTEDGDPLETLWNASVDWRRATTPGSYFGVELNDIYTDDVKREDTLGDGTRLVGENDFNRASGAAYYNRVRGFLELYGQIGATRYDTEQQSINGLNAVLRATRTLGPASTLSLALSRDLSDQTLSTVESLIEDGSGVEPEADGFFDETRLELVYALSSSRTSADAGIGVAQLDYRALTRADGSGIVGASEDQLQSYAFGFLTRPLTSRLRGEIGARYERQTYDRRQDEADSILGQARLLYRLSRSFELEVGYVFDSAVGTRTRVQGGVNGVRVPESIDVTENRVNIGIRWAPPSRASRDLTIELKTLLR